MPNRNSDPTPLEPATGPQFLSQALRVDLKCCSYLLSVRALSTHAARPAPSLLADLPFCPALRARTLCLCTALTLLLAAAGALASAPSRTLRCSATRSRRSFTGL